MHLEQLHEDDDILEKHEQRHQLYQMIISENEENEDDDELLSDPQHYKITHTLGGNLLRIIHMI